MDISFAETDTSLQTDNLIEETSSFSSSSDVSLEELENSQDIAFEGFPYTSNFLELDNGLNLHYLDEGSGDPIILLHGIPTSSYLWRNIIPELAERGRVIVPDLVNFGLSDKTDEPLNFVEHGELISEFITDLGLEDITLVGHDWGGPIGLSYAVDNPDNIEAIAYFESPVVPLPDVDALRSLGIGGFVDTFIDPANSETNIIDNNLFVEGYLFNPLFGAIAEPLSEEAQAVYREAFLTPESREQLLTFPLELPLLDTTGHPVYDPDGVGGEPPEPVPNLDEFINFANYLAITDSPQLLILGNPGLAPRELILPLAAQIPGVEIQEVGDENNPVFHFIPEDAPEELSEVLAEWYDASVAVDESELGSTITLEITIENLAPERGIGIAQTWYGFHDGSFDLYNVGEEASLALEILSEDGITGIEPVIPGILEEAISFGAIPANFPAVQDTVAGQFAVSPAGLNGGTQGMVFTDNRIPPFFLVQNPGETITATVTIDRDNIANNRFFNYGAMLFPTNDGFIANDDPQAIEIFDEDGNFMGADLTITGEDVLDSGTEVNDEDPTNVLYELDKIGNSIDENGTIQPFPGFFAPGDGGVLDFEVDGEAVFANADFTVPDYPIARIKVSTVDEPVGEYPVEPVIIDFEQGNLAAGTVVTDQFDGVEFSTSSEFGLMLFDSDNITGQDFDLGATGLGNILIISEDGNSDNPDDNAAGGIIAVEFDELTQVNRVGLLDIDEPGSSITFYGVDESIIDTVEIDSLDDNSFQELTIDVVDVARMEINLVGSGALTELDFSSSSSNSLSDISADDDLIGIENINGTSIDHL